MLSGTFLEVVYYKKTRWVPGVLSPSSEGHWMLYSIASLVDVTACALSLQVKINDDLKGDETGNSLPEQKLNKVE